jgi:hypothetical protein
MVASIFGRDAFKSFFLVICSSFFFAITSAAQDSREVLLSQENAYNPIPSPDGKFIAYVRTGWGRSGGSGGVGRSNLVSEVVVADADGAPVSHAPLCNSFVSGWTPDSTRLVCYRDWNYALTALDGKTVTSGHIPDTQEPYQRAEWVSYSPSYRTILWSRQTDGSHWIIESPQETIARSEFPIGTRIVPSPDGRYFAAFGTSPDSHLWVYDTHLESWTDLAKITIHPDRNWDYIQPNWTPWFADGSQLVYFVGSVLTISSPDGRQKTEIRIEKPAGLPVPSPDGLSVAFVISEPRPMSMRPDLKFWGGTTITVVSAVPGAQPRAVTQKSPDSTYDLRWLGDKALVFDRIAGEAFYRQARLWKATIRR